jgi:hypothetical protein
MIFHILHNFYLFNSDFGLRFRGAAEKINVKIGHDGFESGMLEIDNNDWKLFMQELSSL